METKKELLTIVGSAVYASVFRQRTKKLLASLRQAAGNQRRQALASGAEDEVSEEVVVWGDRDEGGGGGTDVLTLDPWMWEFKIEILDKFGPLPVPGPAPTGDDTPEPADPCKSLAQSLASLKSVLAADQTALKAIDELIAAAKTPAERKALQQQKQETRRSIQETKQLAADIKDEMKKLDC